MAIMLNSRSNVYENIFSSASQPPDSSTLLQPAGIAVARPVVIPKYVGVSLGIIGNNMRTDGMSRGRSFELLGEL